MLRWTVNETTDKVKAEDKNACMYEAAAVDKSLNMEHPGTSNDYDNYEKNM